MSNPIEAPAEGIAGEPVNAVVPVPARSAGRFVYAFRKPVPAIAAFVLLVVAIAAIFAPLIATHDPLKSELTSLYQGPSGDHLLGTDKLGRDVFSRMVYGARTSMLAALEAVAVSLLLGLPFGLIAGYFGGWLDRLFSRTNDGIMSIPGITLALAVIAVLGPGLGNAMLAAGITFAPQVFRVTRAATLEVRELTYIEASTALGCSRARVMFAHVLPNIVSPLLVVVSVSLGLAVLFEGGLSFIGVGVTAPTPSWGSMLFDARQRLDLGYLIYAPGIALTVTVAAFTTVGDAIRDALGVSRAGDSV